MKFKHDFTDIQNISEGKIVYFNQTGERESIGLKESALLWWEKQNNESLADKLLRRISKNNNLFAAVFEKKGYKASYMMERAKKAEINVRLIKRIFQIFAGITLRVCGVSKE